MKIFSYLLLATFIFSCTNNSPGSKKDEILQKFDSVNRSLEKITDSATISDKTYDSLLNKLATEGSGSIRQMYYSVHDFYGYIDNLKSQFFRFCGDSSGTRLPTNKESNLDATNAFFQVEKFPSRSVFPVLESAITSLRAQALSDRAKNMIDQFASTTTERFPSPEKFVAGYFKNTPPVAAVTTLDAFKMKVKTIESVILVEYFKNKK